MQFILVCYMLFYSIVHVIGNEKIYTVLIGDELEISFDKHVQVPIYNFYDRILLRSERIKLFRSGYGEDLQHGFIYKYKYNSDNILLTLSEFSLSDDGKYFIYDGSYVIFEFILRIRVGICKKLDIDDKNQKLSCKTSPNIEYDWMLDNKLIGRNNGVNISINNDKSKGIYEMMIIFKRFNKNSYVFRLVSSDDNMYITNPMVVRSIKNPLIRYIPYSDDMIKTLLNCSWINIESQYSEEILLSNIGKLRDDKSICHIRLLNFNE